MAGSSGNHRDLLVWQRAMDLVVACYRFTRRFPESELYGLTSQIRRAAVSVPSNIAEGRSRGSRKAFANFLWIANGSLAELETQVELARRLNTGPSDDAAYLLHEIDVLGRMVTRLRQSLK